MGSKIVNSNFDLTINVIDHLIIGNLSMHEIDLKIYDRNFFMMTYHMNCMLVCNVGEMMKICTGCTCLLGSMYLDT